MEETVIMIKNEKKKQFIIILNLQHFPLITVKLNKAEK